LTILTFLHSYFLAAAKEELLGGFPSRLQLGAFQKIPIQSISDQAVMNAATNTAMNICGQAAMNKEVDFIMIILLHQQNILHTAG
jgi:hypothetical protein